MKEMLKQIDNLCDELHYLDKTITRVQEDTYNILIEKGIMDESEIYPNTLIAINRKKELRQELQTLLNKK